MTEPKIEIACVANLFSRQMHFVAVGDTEYGHTHPFDHMTLLAYGSLRVTVGDKATDFHAPAHIYIKAEVQHELIALEPNTVAYCIHALRNGHGVEDIIDPESIPVGVNATDYSLPLNNLDGFTMTVPRRTL